MRKYALAGVFFVLLVGICGPSLARGVAFADEDSPLASGVIGVGEFNVAFDVPDASDTPDASDDEAPVHADGWEKDGKAWHYWKDGEQVKGDWVDTAIAPGKKKAGAEIRRYWIDRSGSLATARLINPGKKKDASDTAYYAYATKSGAIAVGKKKVVGKTTTKVYLAKTKGPRIGELESGNEFGILRTSSYDKGAKRSYYITSNAHCAIVKNDLTEAEPVKVEGFGWVLPCNKGGYLLSGAKKKMGDRVYLAQPNGRLESGNVTVQGELTSIVKTKAYDKGTLRYYYIDPETHSAVVKDEAVAAERFGWVLPCNKGGYLATGRKVIGDKVYLARDNGKLETGNDQGFLSSSRYDANGEKRRYYIDPKTHAITYGKPVMVEGFGYVYAPNKEGYMLRGLTRVDSTHIILADKQGHVFNNRGWLVTDAFTGGLERYWVEPTKANKNVLGARIGYFKVNGSLFQGLGQGYVLRNVRQLRGKTYYWVDNEGVFNKEPIVTRLYRKAQGYSSPTRYLIMVDVDNPKVLVLQGSRGHWKVKHVWDCCTGSTSTPTVTGTFHIADKGYSFGEGSGYSCYYWSQFYGGYLFHSQLYYPYSSRIQDGSMGIRCSHGCVRLHLVNAYWIYRNVPRGTTVACIY